MRWTHSPLAVLLGCCLTTAAPARPQATEDTWRIQYTNAQDAVREGRYPEAVAFFLEAIHQAEELGRNERLAESLNGLAQVYRYQQNHAEAERLARQSLAILERSFGGSHPAILPSLVNLAGVAQSTGRYAEAEQIYRRALSVRWGLPDATGTSAGQVLEALAEALTLAYAHDPTLENALDDYWKLISDASLNKTMFGVMRETLLAVPLVAEAEALMQRAIRLYPESRQLRYQFAELYVSWGKYEKAMEMFEQAARFNDGSDPATERSQRALIYAKIAQMHFYLVQFDDALSTLTKALEINPDSPSARLLAGALYLRRNKFEEAAAEYRRVISADPAVAAAYDGLAQIHLTLGRYSECVRDAEKALQIDPWLQSARYVKAMALIRGGHDPEGRATLAEYQRREEEREKLRIDSAEVRRVSLEAGSLLAKDQRAAAMAWLQDGVRSFPQAANLYLTLGLTQSRLGLHREAAETFESMIRQKIDNFLVHRQLGREYEALGNFEGSRRHRVIYLQRYDATLQAISTP
jgi:tetratricopeptide (TPR) repeat protein